MVAVNNLNQTMRTMETTQNRIATGLRVNDASDNAAYWSIAATMKSDNGALSSVKDALNLGSATIDVASSALNSSKDVINEIKEKLIAAAQPGVDRAKVQAEITSLQEQLDSISSSAIFSGQNWLKQDSGAAGYNTIRNVVASFSRDENGAAQLGTIEIDVSQMKLYDIDDQSGIIDKDRTVGSTTASLASIDISALTDSAADMQTLNDYLSITDTALDEVINAASGVGASQVRLDMQSSFISSLNDAVTKGIAALVDADMTQESTRLQALQVQQQLGVQALSIANQNTSMIMRLFQ
jgi:flagellin